MDEAQTDHEKVWNVVKELRKKFLKFSDDSTFDNEMTCSYRSNLLSDMTITANNRIIEEKLGLKSKTFPAAPSENVNSTTLQLAAEMFIYMNNCPLSEYYQYIKIYGNLLQNESPLNIVLGMTDIIKQSQNAAKEASINIFNNAMKRFGLQKFVILHKMKQIMAQSNFLPDMNVTKQLGSDFSEFSEVLGLITQG